MADETKKNPRIRQGWLRVILFVCFFCLMTGLIAIPAILTITDVTLDNLKSDPVHILANQLTGPFLWLMLLLEFVISVVSVWLFRVFIDRRGFPAGLGLEMEGFGAESATGLFMGPALLGISALLLLLTGHMVWTDFSWNPQSLFISLGMLLLIAFSEELVFRGYILGNLLDSFKNPWIALGISSLLFAAFHGTNPGMGALAFVNTFLAGGLLGINYIYTRNLWFSFLLHLGWNFFQGPVMGFRVSGLTLPSMLVNQTTGDLLVTGGDFGLEASILNTAVSVLAIIALAWAFDRKYRPSVVLTA